MKKVLITGTNSFIGTSVEMHLTNSESQYEIDTLDMIDEKWINYDFSQYDSVFHVAGIAHSDVGNATEEDKDLYYKVNTDLTYETAKKAKAAGVRQFIFMSSAIIFGASAPIGTDKFVNKDTEAAPENFYGDSKLKAEIKINTLRDDKFKVCIVRPPMIYGIGSKGNYPLLSKLAKKLPIFPNIDNCRSMIYIENFAEFIRLMIENQEDGVFMPQNSEYSCTSNMVKEIAKSNGKNIKLTKIFNPTLKLISKKYNIVNKAFGNLAYEKSASEYKENYCLYTFEESIKRTEGTHNNKKKALILASVASMILQFNMDNIYLLLEMGYKIDVACNFNNPGNITAECSRQLQNELHSLGVGCYQIDFSRSISEINTNLKSYKQIKKILNQNKYTFIHCHSPIGGIIGRLAANKTKTKAIYTAHGFHFFKEASLTNWLLFYPIEKYFSRYTDTLITINNEDYELSKRKMKAQNIEHIHGIGANSNKFYEISTQEKAKIKEKLHYDTNDKIILCVGELNENKNQKTLIQAMKKVIQEIPTAKLLIAGIGVKNEELDSLIKSLNLQNNIFLLGYCTNIDELYNISDIVTSASFREGLPLNIMEAMLCKNAIVVSSNRGHNELISDSINGYIVSPTDSNSFADRFIELLRDQKRCKQFGEYSYNLIQLYTNENVINETRKIYSRF